MEQENHIYREIKKPSTVSLRVKGSKFIGYSFNITSKDDVKERIADLKKKEHKARHFCFAYILSNNKSIQIVNDDGEPSSTAGKPILRQILSKDLTNVLIVVVRFFNTDFSQQKFVEFFKMIKSNVEYAIFGFL